MTDVDRTLKERGSIYGAYGPGVEARANIMMILQQLHINEHNREMNPVDAGMLWDIVNKIVRLGTCPHHVDSWHDIQGYAKLAETFHDQPMENMETTHATK